MAAKRTAQGGIQEVDVHGMNTYQAKVCLKAALKRANSSVYRIRVIHGYHGGPAIRDMVRNELAHDPKVLRVELGLNQGETDLVLRELY